MDRSKMNSGMWKGCGSECPSQEVVFFAQITLIFIVVIAAVVNLALDTGKTEFWAGTLSGCIGYILPAPAIMFKKKSEAIRDEAQPFFQPAVGKKENDGGPRL